MLIRPLCLWPCHITYLLWRSIYSLPIFNWVVLLLTCESSLYILDESPYQTLMWLANIFYFSRLSFHFLDDVLWSTTVFSFDDVNFIHFLFLLCLWCPEKPLLIQVMKICPVFSSKCFTFTFRSLIHFNFYLWWLVQCCSFSWGYRVAPAPLVEKTSFSPIELSWHPCWKIIWQ